MENQSQIRVRLFGVLTTVATILLSILAVEWALRYLERSVGGSETMDPGFILYDDRYGWKLNPGWRGTHTHHDFSVHYEVNALGFRGDAQAVKAEHKVFFLGDSFTFGLGVDEGETFVDLLNSSAGYEELEYSNFSVPGYSTDQQLLLLEGISMYRPDSLVWSIYLGNDLLDNRYPFPLQADYSKPVFRLEDGGLVLSNIPVPRQAKSGVYREMNVESAIIGEFELYSPFQRLLKESRLGQRINSLMGLDVDGLRESMALQMEEDIRLFLAMIQEAETLLQKTDSELSFLLLPGSGFFVEGSVPSAYQTMLEDRLAEALRSRGYQVGLPSERLKRAQSEGQVVYHPNEGHLTPAGHQVVMEYLDTANLW